MSFDANAHRASSLAGWEEAASGWVRRQDAIRAFGAPVSEWMLDSLELRPGARVLELAAGLGETGMLAAGSEIPRPAASSSTSSPGFSDTASSIQRDTGAPRARIAS